MNIEKARKRIAKMVNKGFQGYPMINITYFGPTDKLATKVILEFIVEEEGEAQLEPFNTDTDIIEDVSVQTTILKIIQRSGAKTVTLDEHIKSL